MKKINVISYGGGVNSTALIILMYHNRVPIDLIIFADPGNEMPETYKFIKVFKKWLQDRGLSLVTVKSHLGELREYHIKKKIFPFRMFRSCSAKWKIRPINKYIKKHYTGLAINVFLGIDAGESRRAKESREKNQTLVYPLVEQAIGRAGCVQIIKEVGLPVPVKSGCYFCPFQKKSEWVKLLNDYPDLFELSIELEENGRGFPEFTLGPISLRKLRKIAQSQTQLISFMKKKGPRSVEGCIYCEV